jgi:hypothetical protein
LLVGAGKIQHKGFCGSLSGSPAGARLPPTDETRARRAYSINEILIRLVSQRIAVECGKMVEAGADIQQVNEVLPDVLLYYDVWREETLSRMMREFDDLERQAWSGDPSPLKPLTPN